MPSASSLKRGMTKSDDLGHCRHEDGFYMQQQAGDDLVSFMLDLGFSEDEVEGCIIELEGFRSIPGTILRRYINRAAASLGENERPAFLKGVFVGFSIRLAAKKDLQEEAVFSEEDRRIDQELERFFVDRQQYSNPR